MTLEDREAWVELFIPQVVRHLYLVPELNTVDIYVCLKRPFHLPYSRIVFLVHFPVILLSIFLFPNTIHIVVGNGFQVIIRFCG